MIIKFTITKRFYFTRNDFENKEYEENFGTLLSQATSGQEFSGLPFRTFPQHLRKFHQDKVIKSKKIAESKWNCTKWGVVTTIFAPPKQEAVRRFLYREDWCVVVVGDKNKPKVQSFKNKTEKQSQKALQIQHIS